MHIHISAWTAVTRHGLPFQCMDCRNKAWTARGFPCQFMDCHFSACVDMAMHGLTCQCMNWHNNAKASLLLRGMSVIALTPMSVHLMSCQCIDYRALNAIIMQGVPCLHMDLRYSCHVGAVTALLVHGLTCQCMDCHVIGTALSMNWRHLSVMTALKVYGMSMQRLPCQCMDCHVSVPVWVAMLVLGTVNQLQDHHISAWTVISAQGLPCQCMNFHISARTVLLMHWMSSVCPDCLVSAWNVSANTMSVHELLWPRMSCNVSAWTVISA
jgi:hypothetical protein